ncbi:MAG TPA: metalloregulator ArsR/SmtB family transcription factor [Thermoleophilia bacterium]|nr:metalloregulator ArsR/SmtB family transcription factor [Thermoleophilia bacterium]
MSDERSLSAAANGGAVDARTQAPTVAAVEAIAPGEAAAIAALFRVLGDASRCRLVYALLEHGEICVGELAEHLDMSESNVSHHLSVLRAHGLVRFRREGKQVFYAPDDEHIRVLLDITRDHVGHGRDQSDGVAPAGEVSR